MGNSVFLRYFPIALAVVALVATDCLCYGSILQSIPDGSTPVPSPSTSCCSQETCAILFDRLEEQSNRLHRLEEVLLRAISISGDSQVETALRSQPMSEWLESQIRDRKKRQTDVPSPKERLAEVLKWAKKISTPPFDTTDATRKLGNKKTTTDFEISPPIIQNAQSADLIHTVSQPTANKTFSSRAGTGVSAVVTSKPTQTPSPVFSSSFKENSTNNDTLLLPTNMTATTPSVPSVVNQMASQKFVSDVVNDLQAAVKCAMAQLNETNTSDPVGVLMEPQAILNANNTLTIQFELKTCQKYWVAVWIRIFVRNEFIPFGRSGNSSGETNDSLLALHVPKECLKKRGNVFWLTLPSNGKGPCFFPLLRLIECKVYTVEIIPIYFTLHGQLSSVEITVPPHSSGNSTNLASLEYSLQNSTRVLGLKWSATSGDCAQLMTAANLRIYEDASDTVLRSFVVPEECLGNRYQNSFSTSFSSLENSNDASCTSVTWEPLDICRKYKLEVEPEYYYSFRGKSSSLEIFTSGADSTNCCFMLTSPTGSFRSYNYDGNSNGCTWLISVERNSTIWLTFTEFAIEGSYYRLRVYDGSYSTSPLLIEQYGYQLPKPVRSRSNKLFIQLARQYYRTTDGKSFAAHYISVKDTRPYVAGCSGYIVNTGTITKPTYPPTESSSSECIWYVESSGARRNLLITTGSGSAVPFPIIVHDGWSTDGKMIYNNTHLSSRASIYSIGSKVLLKFPAWNSLEREREYSWNIFSMIDEENCSYNLTSSSDTFSSNNEAAMYSSFIDCRWTIRAENSSNIRLTFVYFDTEKDNDFVTVHDGPTVYSTVLLELSGNIKKPVSLTSTTNEFLVRFTTNGNSNNGTFYKGFLAFYTTVPCNDKRIDTNISYDNMDNGSNAETKHVPTTVPTTIPTTIPTYLTTNVTTPWWKYGDSVEFRYSKGGTH